LLANIVRNMGTLRRHLTSLKIKRLAATS
jgi:hypothetical protein